MTEKLKPCPFCGGEADHNDGGNSVYGRFWWCVGCENCDVWFLDPEVWAKDASGRLDTGFPPKTCFTTWNNRADTPTHNVRVKSLVKALQWYADETNWE